MRIEAGDYAEDPIATPELYDRPGLNRLENWVSGRVAHFKLNHGLPLLPVQFDVFNATVPLIGCFGSYRSGKTRAGALKTLQIAAENPWRAIYEGNNPTSVAITETLRVVRDSAYREFTDLCPRELILRTWESPQNFRIRLVNGHDVIFRQWKGKVEGLSACCVWLDEAQKLDGPDGPQKLWKNFLMRASDPRAKRRCVIATGLPEYGWLSEIFDLPNTEDRITILCSLRQNQYLTDDVIRGLFAATTKEEAEVVIEGKWRKPESVIYYAFAFGQNTTDYAGDRSKPVHISIDLGDKGAIVVGQNITVICKDHLGKTYRDKGLVIVDEILPDNKSVKDALRDFVAEGKWHLGPGSRVYVDPKADRDELAAIREVLGAGERGGPKIVKKPPKEEGYSIDYGHRCANAAFRDYHGNVRLFIYSGLGRSKRSLIPGLLSHKRKPNGHPLRDNIVDHVLDSLRYMVVDQMPLRSAGFSVMGKAA